MQHLLDKYNCEKIIDTGLSVCPKCGKVWLDAQAKSMVVEGWWAPAHIKTAQLDLGDAKKRLIQLDVHTCSDCGTEWIDDLYELKFTADEKGGNT